MAKAHTARFLQTFHSAQTQAQRTAASQTDAPTDHADTDPAALAFVRGHRPAGETPERRLAVPARNDGSYEATIKGHKVRCGAAFVSEAQAKWMIDIATTRVLPTGRTAEQVLVRLEQGFAKSAGSQFITQYKDLPREGPKQVQTQPTHSATGERPHIADGRYAVEEDGTLLFFRVKSGRKAGFVFLDVQASDDWHSIRNPRRITAILASIAEVGEHEAMVRYGHELGVCGRCGRTLTDEASRAAGIGPVCIDK